MQKMRIGILGTGDVGRQLGSGFAALGHTVKIGSRDPKSDKLRQWARSQWRRGIHRLLRRCGEVRATSS